MIKKFLPFLLSGVFFIIGVLTLSDYGINWDEPVHFMRGQAYLHYYLTGQKDYQSLPKLKIHYPKNDRYDLTDRIDFEDDRQFRRSLYQSDYWNGEWFFTNDSPHPPLNDILASLTNFVFYQKLGILKDVEAYHLFEIFTGAIVVLIASLFAQQIYGHLASFVTGLALMAYPLFWAESHFNIKDPVITCFFSLTIYAFYRAVKLKSIKWVVLTGFFIGLALGTKLNIVFVVLILLPWLIARYFPFKKLNFSKNFYLSWLLVPVIALLIFFASWPYLWQDPLAGMKETFVYYRDIGTKQDFQPENFYTRGFNTYPFKAITFTTPLVILFLTGVGIVTVIFYFKKEKEKTGLLWLLWFLVPVVRVSIPGATIYGGVRQIMEYIPAMALLAGLGAHRLRGLMIENLKFKITSFVFYFVFILAFLPIALKMIEIHPNEGLYFNSLIGGLRGAVEKDFPHWGMSLGNEYRQGIEWFNQHAEEEADLTLARGLLSNIPRIWIRSDINFGGHYFSGSDKRGEYIMGLVYEGWQGWIPQKAIYLMGLEPVYQLKMDGVSVLNIWEND